MPLVAKSLSTGDRVDVSAMFGRDIRMYYPPNDFVCPYCETPMHFRKGHLRGKYWVNQHFVHDETCKYDRHNETPEHLLGKEWLKRGLASAYKGHNKVEIELEVPIDMDWRPRGRIADIMVTFDQGWKEIHEIQLSAITVQDLAERTADYERCGYDVTWWFGPNNNKDQIRDWCYRLFGVFYLIQVAYADSKHFYDGFNGKDPD